MLLCMQLDNGNASYCEARNVTYRGLQDGNHTFEVCANGFQEVGCATYNWTIGKDFSFCHFPIITLLIRTINFFK